MKKISIIIPVYNVEKYLVKCLDSLVKQDLKKCEIILVNDGSSDNSQIIIDDYKMKYPNYIKAYVKENGGQGSARNLGISKACGEYICFIDSDDYVEPNFIEEICNCLLEDKYDIIVFDMYKKYESKKNKEYLKGIINYADDIQKNYILSLSGPCNKVMKKKLWVDNHLAFLENTIYEDLAIIPTIAKYTNKIKYLEKPLYNYLIHNGSTMNQTIYTEKLKNIFKVMEQLSLELKNDFPEELEYLYITNLLHGAGLRFLKFSEGISDIKEVSLIMHNQFPNWKKNIYLKNNDFKYRIICHLIYKKNIKALKLLLK